MGERRTLLSSTPGAIEANQSSSFPEKVGRQRRPLEAGLKLVATKEEAILLFNRMCK